MAGSKRLAPNYAVPQTDAEADEMIRQLGRKRRERAALKLKLDERLAAAKERHGETDEPLREEVERLELGLDRYCSVHRDRLTKGGKIKTARFVNGEVKWRWRPPAVVSADSCSLTFAAPST